MEESMIIDIFPGDFIDLDRSRDQFSRIKENREQERYGVTTDTNILKIDFGLVHCFLRLIKSRLTNRVRNTVLPLSNVSVISTVNAFIDRVLNLTVQRNYETFRVFGVNYHFACNISRIIDRSSKIIDRKCDLGYVSLIKGGACNFLPDNSEFFFMDKQKVDFHHETDDLVEIIDLDDWDVKSKNLSVRKSRKIDNQIINIEDSNDTIIMLDDSESDDGIIDLNDLDLYDEFHDSTTKRKIDNTSSMVPSKKPKQASPNKNKTEKNQFLMATPLKKPEIQSFDKFFTPPVKTPSLVCPKRKFEAVSYTPLVRKCPETIVNDSMTPQKERFDLDDFDSFFTPPVKAPGFVIPNRNIQEISYTPVIKKCTETIVNNSLPQTSPLESRKRTRLDFDSECDSKRPKLDKRNQSVPKVHKKDPREINDNTNPAWRKLRARNPKEALELVKREWGVTHLSNPHVNLSHCFINGVFHPIYRCDNGNRRTVSCLSVFDSKIRSLNEKLNYVNRQIVTLYRRLSTVYDHGREYYSINKEIETLKNRENRYRNRYGAVMDARTEMQNLYRFYAAGCSDFVANVPEVDANLFERYEEIYRR